jgi:hypothetical protein
MSFVLRTSDGHLSGTAYHTRDCSSVTKRVKIGFVKKELSEEAAKEFGFTLCSDCSRRPKGSERRGYQKSRRALQVSMAEAIGIEVHEHELDRVLQRLLEYGFRVSRTFHEVPSGKEKPLP